MKRFLVINSGSSSEKIAFYEGEKEIYALYLENVEKDLGEIEKVIEEKGLAGKEFVPDGILIRVVAAGEYFARHRIVDEQTFEELKKVRVTNPLHVISTERGIKNAQKMFPGVPVILMSDTAALVNESRRDLHYALPREINQKFDLARWGAHGASYGYIMERIRELDLLEDRMVVCHLGSGCSITALVKGKPVYTSMGETPLEGLMSSTRAGSIDPTIGALLGEEMGATEAIKLMNKQSGLLALAGSSDMREIIEEAEKGNKDAVEAYEMFIDGIVGKIGEFAAKMGGLDAIVFTATIGERSVLIRNSIVAKLGFMGFEIDNSMRVDKIEDYINVAKKESKPIYIIPTNEASYMIKEASKLLDNIK